jgi:precorrin-2/cobalt-factor-2 C20-methyltransferase
MTRNHVRDNKIGKLYGVGVGPGDPQLLTIRAKKVLEKIDVVCAPMAKKGKPCIALKIAERMFGRDVEVMTPHFPMGKDHTALDKYWNKAAEDIYSKLSEGKDVAFVSLGDPTFYSTYNYVLKKMREKYPNVKIETVPGIPSTMACMANLGNPLVEGDEKLAVVPAEYGLEGLEEIVKVFDTIVLMKVSRSFDRILDILDREGLADRSIVMSRCGQEDFEYFDLLDMASTKGKKVDFRSMIIIKKGGFEKSG